MQPITLSEIQQYSGLLIYIYLKHSMTSPTEIFKMFLWRDTILASIFRLNLVDNDICVVYVINKVGEQIYIDTLDIFSF